MTKRLIMGALYAPLVLTAILVSTATLYAPVSTLKKNLNLAELDTSIACTLFSSAGDMVEDLTAAEKARVCILCGDEWAKDEKNTGKALAKACGKLGSPTQLQKEIVTKALADGVASTNACSALAHLYKKFDLLSPEQRIQALGCFNAWSGKHLKAQKALLTVVKAEDIDDSKEKIGDIPSWEEVVQEQTLDKSDPKGQVTKEITQEEYNAVVKKR